MMMPANFSAIAESEMTYVVGGGLIDALGAVTAPIWNADNVKTFNTNLVTIVGNSYVNKVLAGTLSVMFGGNWGVKETVDGKDVKTKNGFIFGKDNALWSQLDPNGDKKTNGFNKFMQGVGALAAVYTLGTAKTKSYVAENTLTIKG